MSEPALLTKKKAPLAAPKPPAPKPPRPEDATEHTSGVRLWKSEITTAPTALGNTSEIAKTSVINNSGSPIAVERIVDDTGMFPEELELYGFAENTPVEPGGRLVLDFAYRPKRVGAYTVNLHIHLESGEVLELLVRGTGIEKSSAPSAAGERKGRTKESGEKEKRKSAKAGASKSPPTSVELVSAQFELLLNRLRAGAGTALRRIDEPKAESSSQAVELLTLAASFAITAAAGGVGAAINHGLRAAVGLVAAKGVADATKRAIEDSYEAAVGGAETLPFGSLTYQFDQAHIKKLGRAESAALDAFHSRVIPLLELQDAAGIAAIKQQIVACGEKAENLQRRMTMAAWANFMAQYQHGNSGQKDMSVDPKKITEQGLLENKQRFQQQPHHGILEVNIGFELHEMEGGKRGISSEPWGLSLRGVGDNVKRTMSEPEKRKNPETGKPVQRLVKDVPLNRIIRGFWIGHTRLSPALPAISVLVAPDNSIKAVNKTPVHISSLSGKPPPEPPISGQELFEMAAHVPMSLLK